MGNKVVNHNSRVSKTTINFPVGVVSWPFESLRTNSIIRIDTTNCTISTIGGFSPSYPISVTANTYYSVVITPTNESLPASITIVTRLNNTPSEVVVNAVNLNNSAWDGNKLYVLTDTKLLIFDATKFNLSNYLGSGSYTQSPYIEAVTLPTQPSGDTGYLSTYWHDLIFVKHSGTLGKMLIGGKPRPANGDYTISYSYYFLFDVETKAITDLAGNANQLTRTSGTDNLGTIYNIMYDYVNELIYPIQLGHNSGQIWRYFNLPYTSQALIVDVKKQVFAQARGIRNFFNPYTQSFSGRWWAKLLTNTYVTQNSQILGLGANSGGYGFQYNYKDGYYYMQYDSVTNYIAKKDSNGNQVAVTRMNPDFNLGTIFYLLDADIGILMNISVLTLRVGWISLTDNTKSYNYIQSTDILAGQTVFKNICSSKANNTFFTIGTSGTATRLYCFKPNVASQTMDVMYYDLPTGITVNSINTNQLLK